MKIGLIDVDMESRGKCTFPNLALMKLSAFHRNRGDAVSWYNPETSGHMDIVYMSKVFSAEYTRDYIQPIDADVIVKGGSGYAIDVENGREVYHKDRDPDLPCEVAHIMPDYSIYEPFGIHDTAYGFLTVGCPRGCDFCHVQRMQGGTVRNYSKLSEFWDGQRNIVLLDPNITGSPNCVEIFNELAHTGARIDFSQGLDIRLMTEARTAALNAVRLRHVHFAWDNPREDLRDKFIMLSQNLQNVKSHGITVYCLTNFDSTFPEDLYRVTFLRSIGMQPYVMIYRKQTAPAITRRLQRWCNWASLFWKYPSFEEYQKDNYKEVLYSDGEV